MKLKIDGKEFSVGLSNTSKGTAIKINGRNIRPRGHEKIKVAKKTDTTYNIGIGQDTYQVELEDYSRPVKSKVKAPMQGIITSVDVGQGQQVKKGQTLFRMMAMKMENEIKAESDCTVKTVLAKARQRVAKGETIIELEDIDDRK
jgi:biotin carboxyl carrier protein